MIRVRFPERPGGCPEPALRSITLHDFIPPAFSSRRLTRIPLSGRLAGPRWRSARGLYRHAADPVGHGLRRSSGKRSSETFWFLPDDFQVGFCGRLLRGDGSATTCCVWRGSGSAGRCELPHRRFIPPRFGRITAKTFVMPINEDMFFLRDCGGAEAGSRPASYASWDSVAVTPGAILASRRVIAPDRPAPR